LVVETMTPPSPTAEHALVVSHEMPYSEAKLPELCAAQLDPPLVVDSTLPPSPTAQHTLVVGHATAHSVLAVPEIWEFQFSPAFVVARIVPPDPTAQQTLDVAHDTPYKPLTPPEACGVTSVLAASAPALKISWHPKTARPTASAPNTLR
jgi:hypothetical protein